jgi:hypothetical protein
MVRCKMVCTEKAERFNQWSQQPEKETVVVKLTAANGPQNQTWSKYTPTGSIELQITNPAAFEQFKLGQAYFVDFVEAPLAEADEQK